MKKIVKNYQTKDITGKEARKFEDLRPFSNQDPIQLQVVS